MALELAKEETLYEAAVVVGKHNKEDKERGEELLNSVNRLHDEAVNDKRLYQMKDIHKKGTAGFNREVKGIMQQVNPLYDGVGIEEQFRPEEADAVAILEHINEDARKLRDEDEMLNNA